jgi:hypothetical protein
VLVAGDGAAAPAERQARECVDREKGSAVWEFECSTDTAASRASLWTLWSNPNRWSEFDRGVSWARLDGELAQGAKIELKPKGGPKSTVDVVAFEPGERFAILAKLPLAKMRFEHAVLDSGDGGSRLSSEIRVTGALSWLFPRLFGLRSNAVDLQANLARLAESGTEPPPE